MRRIIGYVLLLVISVNLCIKPNPTIVNATEGSSIANIDLTTKSVVSINPVFGRYMKQVDENIYYSLATVDASSLDAIYGNCSTPVYLKAREWINPCMALATTWGEAGRSYKGVSLTTIMDFDPNTYVTEVDWISVTRNLEQVDSLWYLGNTMANYNTNEEGKAFHMPVNLLQHPRGGDRRTSAMTGLGVGPFQVTSSNWEVYTLDERVNPIWAWEVSLRKVGTSWTKCGIDPISDLTVYALLSMGHQGGNLITMDFGKQLINKINTKSVQDAFNEVGKQIYEDAFEKATTKDISLSNVNIDAYLPILEQKSGVDFSNYTGGAGSTNKGEYVAKHCLRYVFYKYYFTSGL